MNKSQFKSRLHFLRGLEVRSALFWRQKKNQNPADKRRDSFAAGALFRARQAAANLRREERTT